MRKYIVQRDNLFSVGQIIEAENDGVEFKAYQDTIHQVQYLGFDKQNGLYRCRMIAFDNGDNQNTDYHWCLHELHAIDDRQCHQNKEFAAGDKVHVRIKNRVGKISNRRYSKTLDGRQAKHGVWVKAVVLEILPDKKYIVEHVEWNEVTGNRGRTTIVVKHKDIRDAYK